MVPEAAVRAQLADLARSLRPGGLDAEGFAAIHRIRTPAELDGLVLERKAATARQGSRQ